MAKVVRFHETGGPEVLRIEDLDVKPPGQGEIQIEVKAIGLNRAETMFRSGRYIEVPRLPARLGHEASGTVKQVGPGVQGFAIGDSVSVIPSFSLNDYGMYAEVTNVPARSVAKNPASLSFAEAAASWMQFATAYGALIDIAGMTKGDAVAIPAASSSVGLASIQIANRVGAIPIALTRGSSKRQVLLDAGAAHVVVTEEQDIVKEILRVTEGKGVRVVFDPVAGPLFEKLVEVTMPRGYLFIYGALSFEPTPLPTLGVLTKWLKIQGYVVHEITLDPVRLEKAKTFILDGLADGSLKPIIAKTFPFDEIIEAHRYLERNEQFGKVVVNV